MNDYGRAQHSCNHNYCSVCIPELSPDYWRKRAHDAEARNAVLDKENEYLRSQLARFWS
jgi:hypothetical protein